jgi:hypothetical protein
LATAALLTLAAPAAAAPPERSVASGCDDFGGTILYCQTTVRKIKTTVTPSGNLMMKVWGTDIIEVTSDSGERSYFREDWKSQSLIQPGTERLFRFRSTSTSSEADVTCTRTFYYKVTNGKVQADDLKVSCST